MGFGNKTVNYKKRPTKQENWRKRKQKSKLWRETKLIEEVKKQQSINPEKQDETKSTVKEHDEEETACCSNETETETQSKGRHYTISIALPGSILNNAQSPELRTYLAGQIARAAAIFQIDEIIVFDEDAKITEKDFETALSGQEISPAARKGSGNFQLAKILEFLECPQYLRKYLFPLQKELQHAGLLNPLDCLHHFRSDDLKIPFREGITLQKPTKNGEGSFCYVGLSKEVLVDKEIQADVRVTVKLTTFDLTKKKLCGVVVSPNEPVKTCGYYWGYNVRLAKSIKLVFDECPYVDGGGYDLTIGTSEKGRNIDEIKRFPTFRHLLIVFGGVNGLETCVENDQSLSVDDPSALFQYYLNTCPDQGSRTIRTEEAILITLSALRPKLLRGQRRI